MAQSLEIGPFSFPDPATVPGFFVPSPSRGELSPRAFPRLGSDTTH